MFCCICLEDYKDDFKYWNMLDCCINYVCKYCYMSLLEHEIKKCPLCRRKIKY